MFFEDNSEEAIVSKRIILSGDNLIDAQPRMDNQTNQTVVLFQWIDWVQKNLQKLL